MNQDHSKSNDKSYRHTSLEDSALKKIEAQLAERLVAQPVQIDREQLMRHASWQAGWAAAHRQQELQEELELASPSTNATFNTETFTWTIALGGFAMASLLIVMIFVNQDEPVDSPEALQASTEQDSVKQAASNQIVDNTKSDMPVSTSSPLYASSESLGAEEPRATRIEPTVQATIRGESGRGGINKADIYDAWISNRVDSLGRPIYRAGLGIFAPDDLDWATEARPKQKDDDSPKTSIPMQNASRQRATAHNMMRDWLIQTKKLESD